MDRMPLSFCLEACGGTLLQGDPNMTFSGVSTDTRQVEAGQLFIALAGDRHDAHAFLREASERGAAAVVVERGRVSPATVDCAVVGVDNTRAALGRLAAQWRRELNLRVVAVAGSNGKTTTKELVASVLRQRFNVLASEASFNNDVGVPLTLLRLKREHDVAVLEAGSNHPGELAPLLRMIRPDLGVLTSLGREHLEFFGDLEGVAREEGWLAELLPAEGHLFINGDIPLRENIVSRCRAEVTAVSLGAEAAWRAERIQVEKLGTSFDLVSPAAGCGGRCRVQLLGRHQVYNALLAAAVGSALGVEGSALRRGLEACEPPRRRMSGWEHRGVQVLDDCYNANADSMMAALQALGEIPCAGRRIAVLGDMAEVGRDAEALHAEVGRCAAGTRVDQLVTVGRLSRVVGAAARSAGLGRVLEFSDAYQAADAVGHLVRPGDLVLVKASRASRLEVVSESLRGVGVGVDLKACA